MYPVPFSPDFITFRVPQRLTLEQSQQAALGERMQGAHADDWLLV